MSHLSIHSWDAMFSGALIIFTVISSNDSSQNLTPQNGLNVSHEALLMQSRREELDLCCIPIYIPQHDLWLFQFISNFPRIFDFCSWSSMPAIPLKFCLFANALNAVAMLLFRLLMKTDPDHWHPASLFECGATCFVVGKHRKYFFSFFNLCFGTVACNGITDSGPAFFTSQEPYQNSMQIHLKPGFCFIESSIPSTPLPHPASPLFNFALFLSTKWMWLREIATKVKEWRNLLQETWKLPICLVNMFKRNNNRVVL